MRVLKTSVGFVLAASALTACLEPQPAPELTQRPSTDFRVTEIQTGLKNPWSVAEQPDGAFLITEKSGKLLSISDGGDRVEIEGLPTDIYASGQGGLLEVVTAPDFSTSADVYISYAYGTDEANGTALLRAQLDGNVLKSPTVIFRSSPPKTAASHFGGKIAFLPDDTLVLTLGDGFAYREDAQKADTHLAKLVRLTRDGGVPQNNPFVGQSKDGREFKPQIYSIGHRNPQGLAYDAQTNTLWQHEHGPRGGDELNQIEPGANYGWPLATEGRDYQGARISPYETFAGMVDPVHGWTPSIAPSGLAIYRGNMFPEWRGDALIGGLASRDLRRVDLENGKSVGEEDLLSDLDGRVRDVRVARDGAVLLLVEDSEDGKLLRLTPK
ncbi:MAG: PQQ-dependent sugar dehydrogenase [Litorimonas sp.]